MTRARTLAALAAMVLAFAACDGSELSSTYPNGGEGTSGSQDARDPESFDIVSGSNQTARAGELLPQPVAVRVLGSGNRPIRNMDVEFVVTSGGGSVASAKAATDRDGVATNRWTLGAAVGTQTLEARVTHPGHGTILASARFTATALDSGSGGSTPGTVTFGSDSFAFDARGQTVVVPVSAEDGQGNTVGASALTWTTTNTGVARVDGSGLVTAWDDGTARIVATLGGVSDTATVVVDREAASVAVIASATSPEAGQEVAFSTRVEDANGHPVGVTPAQLNWSLSGANAELIGAGRVRTVESGQVQVRANYGGVEGTADITVRDPVMPGSVVFSDGLESGSLSAWADGANGAFHTVVRDPSLARSGDHVLRVDYPSGGSAGYLTTFFAPGHDVARIRFWVQLEEGWEGSSNLAGLYGSRTDDQWSAHGNPGVCADGTNHFRSFATVGGSGTSRALAFSTSHMNETAPCTGDDGAGKSTFVSGQGLVPGRWHRVDMEVRANTPGLADGSQSMWIDGELVGQWNALEFRAGHMLALNSAQLSFAADGSSHGARHLLIDDVEVSVTGTPTTSVNLVIDQAPPVLTSIGAQEQLTVTVTDSNGGPIASASPTWSTADATVATVDAQGLVTAVGNGSTTITASYSGATAGVQVTVDERDGGDSGGAGWPNEPTGLNVLTDQPWTALASDGWVHANRRAYSHIVSDPTAPHSGSAVLEHVYPEGFTGDGHEPAVDLIHARGASKLYVGLWFKASPNWHAHATGINKIMFLWNREFDANILLTMRGKGTASWPYRLEILPEGHPEMTDRIARGEGGYMTQNVNQRDMVPGTWHRIEIVVDQAAGSIDWWQDGVHLGSYRGLSLRGNGFSELQVAPTWGGRGTTPKAHDDYFRYDHIRIATGG